MILKDTPDEDRATAFKEYIEDREASVWRNSDTKRELDRLAALKVSDPAAYDAERIPLPLRPGETYEEMLEHRRVQAARDLERAAHEKTIRDHEAELARDAAIRAEILSGKRESDIERYRRLTREAEIARRERELEEVRAREAARERELQEARAREAARLRAQTKIEPPTLVAPPVETPKPRPSVPVTQPTIVLDPEIERIAREYREQIAARKAARLAAEEAARLEALEPKVDPVPIVTERQTTRPAPSDAIASTPPTVSEPKREAAAPPLRPTRDDIPKKTVDRAVEAKRAGIIAAKKRRPKGRGR